jgi:hypothetical protein
MAGFLRGTPDRRCRNDYSNCRNHQYQVTPPVILEFVYALVGVPLAVVGYRSKMLRSSGKWIWIPGIAAMIYDTVAYGPEFARKEFFSGDAVGTTILVVTVSCAVYSLTLLLLSRRDSTRSSVAAPAAPNG